MPINDALAELNGGSQGEKAERQNENGSQSRLQQQKRGNAECKHVRDDVRQRAAGGCRKPERLQGQNH